MYTYFERCFFLGVCDCSGSENVIDLILKYVATTRSQVTDTVTRVDEIAKMVSLNEDQKGAVVFALIFFNKCELIFIQPTLRDYLASNTIVSCKCTSGSEGEEYRRFPSFMQELRVRMANR